MKSLIIIVTLLFYPIFMMGQQNIQLNEDVYAKLNLPQQIPGPKNPLVIAVIDDAFLLTHHQLQGIIYENKGEIPGNFIDDDGNGFTDDVQGWDFGDYDPDTGVTDDNRNRQYHGTMVAGIVSRVVEHVMGPSSRESIRIMPLKVLPDRPGAPDYSQGYPALQYALKMGVDMVVMAWSGGKVPPEYLPLFEKANQEGVVLLGAAGNAFSDQLSPPASLSQVFAVTAVDKTFKKLESANYGSEVDLSAFGKEVKAPHSYADSAWFYAGRTSAAVSLVAGSVAVLMLAEPQARPYHIYEALINTAVPIDSANNRFSAQLGAGIPDVSGALDYLTNPFGRNRYFRSDRPRGILTLGGRNPVDYQLKPTGGIKGFHFQRASVGKPLRKSTLTLKYPGIFQKQFEGDDLPFKWYSAAPQLQITYKGNTKRPLTLHYQAEPVDSATLYCQGIQTIVQDSGFISDGSGPNHYANRTSCKWHIKVDKTKRVKLVFEVMQTQANVDFVHLFHGKSTLPENLLAKFSGHNPPPEIISPGNEVLLWFVTDNSTTDNGWKAHFQAVDEKPGFKLKKKNN